MQSRTKKWLGWLAEGLGAATLLALAGCYATTRPGVVYTTEPEPVYYQPAREQVRVQHRDTYYVQQPAPAPAPATTVYVQEQPAPATTVYVQPQQPPPAATVYVGAVHPQRGAPGHRERPGVVGQRGPGPAQGQGRGEDDDDDDDHDDDRGNGRGRGHGRGRAPH